MQLHRTGDSTFARTPRGLRRRGWGSLHSGGPVPTPVPPQVGQAGHTAAEEVYGGNLVVADLRTLLMLVNEARYRALERLFGLPRNQANILTLVGTMVLAEAAHAKLGPLLRAKAPAPSPGDIALGTATVRHLMLGPAGDSAPGIPMFGALAAIAAGGTVVIPATVKALRGVRTGVREAGSFFSRRYGHHLP